MSRLTGRTRALTAAGVLAVSIVGGYEGLRLYSYQDVIGVWTGCYGETRGMRKGLRFTKVQCDGKLLESLTVHEAGMRYCLKSPDALPDKTYVALLSFTYNVGVAAFCNSTLALYANQGDLDGACAQLLRWDRAGGKVIRGLTIRRQSENKLCIEGLTGAPA